MDKQQKIDAAVGIVLTAAQEALAKRDPTPSDGYVEAYNVASQLEKRGVLPRPDTLGHVYSAEARRLLDAEVASAAPRILRLSSHDHAFIPRLDGTRRGFHGNQVLFTTPELHAAAQAAVDERLAIEQAADRRMADLVERLTFAGVPAPVSFDRITARFSPEALDIILTLITN